MTHKNSVTIHSGASEFVARIMVGGQLTVVDLSKFNKGERVRMMRALVDWKGNDFRGYPDIAA